MSIYEVIRFALRGLSANKLRSGLTMLGILIGVAAVIVLVAVGNGSSHAIQEQIDRLGTNTLTVFNRAGFGRNSSLDLLLPFVFAYGRADAGDLLRLGHGGLIEAGAGRRFPPYS